VTGGLFCLHYEMVLNYCIDDFGTILVRFGNLFVAVRSRPNWRVGVHATPSFKL
jgi:hypothetical protein